MRRISCVLSTAHLKDYGLPRMTFCVADKGGFVATINAGWADVDPRKDGRACEAMDEALGEIFSIGVLRL